MTCFLGIDAGNTGLKAVLFDEGGRELACARRETGGTSPAPGQVERDVLRLRADLTAVVAEVLARSGRGGHEVKGIGSAGHGNGLYLLDAESEPVVAIQSLDTRAAGLVDEWERNGIAEAAQALALQRPWPSQTPTLLAWMVRHRPEALARAAHVLMCKDLVTHMLTGEVVADVTDMGGAGLLALPTNAYDPALLAAYGLGHLDRLLPRLLWPTEVAGVVTAEMAGLTGLRAGTPVVAGFFDVVATAVGSGVTREGEVSVILGTWSINQAVVPHPVPGAFMSCAVAPGRFMAMENSATSAANLEWAVHALMGGAQDFTTADALAAEAPERADAPLYHPFLYGASGHPAARAGLFGVGGWHGRGDLMRALFEGVAFAHLEHLERLSAFGVATHEVTLSGGGSRSPVWPQMLADMMGRPLRVAAQPEAGALGAAMAAAVGVGRFSDLDAAAAAMVAAPRALTPRVDRTALARRRFALWKAVGESLQPHWTALRDLADA